MKPSCGYGVNSSEFTLVSSNVLAPLFPACLNNSSSDSERTTFHEWPPFPSEAAKSVSNVVSGEAPHHPMKIMLTGFLLGGDLECRSKLEAVYSVQ